MASCIHAVIQKDLVSELRMILRRYPTTKYLPVDIFTNKKSKTFQFEFSASSERFLKRISDINISTIWNWGATQESICLLSCNAPNTPITQN